jgi:biopolymer transport protein ExbD
MRLERRLKASINIDLTPLIDVTYQLVIFFMITSVFKTVPGIPMNLPASTSSQSVAVQELRIVVVSENELYLNRKPVELAGLKSALKAFKAEASGAETTAIVEGDSEIPYRLLVRVLDALREAGIADASLSTRPMKE